MEQPQLISQKTKIVHTLDEYNGEAPGFDFLGFHIQHHKQGIHHSGKNTVKELLGFKTIIEPQKDKISLHYRKLDECINKMSSEKQTAMIGKLIPIIRGWCNYQSPWNSSKGIQKVN